MEVVGFSVWSIVFSLMEIVLLTLHIKSVKKFRGKSVKRFALLTLMFIILNGTMIYLPYTSNWSNLINSIRTINSLTIAIYLFAIIFDPLLDNKNNLKRTPWLLVSVAVAIGLQGLSEILPNEIADFDQTLTIVLPVMLSVTLIAFVIRNRIKDQIFSQFQVVISLFFAIATLGTFAFYIDLSQFVLDIPLNIVFLIVTSLYFLNTTRDKASKKDSVNTLDQINFEELGLTKTQQEIARMIVVEQLDYQEISEKRHIAYNTVTSHASNIFDRIEEKYGVSIVRREELTEFLLSLDTKED